MNALYCCNAFHLQISNYLTTINSLNLFPSVKLVNTSPGAFYPLLNLIHLGAGQGRKLFNCKAILPSSLASKMEKQGTSYLPR